ncbi:hypothetical protein A2U01_0098383, partial [Trifolium medium]|nr:hypothetical protein [Trifolium medium]
FTVTWVTDSRTDPLLPSSPVPSPELDVDVHFHLILEKVLPAVRDGRKIQIR